MSKQNQSTTIVTTLDDFDRLLSIAKKHGVVQLKLEGIEVALPPPPMDMRQEPVFTNTVNVDVDAEAHLAYKNL